MASPLSKIIEVVRTRPLRYLGILFFIVQLIIFLVTGVNTHLEAAKYVHEGELLYKSGGVSEAKYIFYLPVILLVYASRAMGISYQWIAIVQIALSYLSMRAFFRMSDRLGGRGVAIITTAMLACFIPLQVWNLYLYSDSIFISLSIIFVCSLSDKIKWWASLSLLTLVMLSRPNGILFIPPFVVFLLFRPGLGAGDRAYAATGAVVLIGAFIFFLSRIFHGGGEIDALKPYIEEHIICFVPTAAANAHVDVVRTGSPIYDLFHFAITHPLLFLRLTMLKLLSFFNLIRPYYSTLHNLYLALYIIPVYLMAMIGIRPFRHSNKRFAVFIFALLIMYPIAIALQCDDWHSRFTVVIFPYFILLAGLGVKKLYLRKQEALS